MSSFCTPPEFILESLKTIPLVESGWMGQHVDRLRSFDGNWKFHNASGGLDLTSSTTREKNTNYLSHCLSGMCKIWFLIYSQYEGPACICLSPPWMERRVSLYRRTSHRRVRPLLRKRLMIHLLSSFFLQSLSSNAVVHIGTPCCQGKCMEI